MPRPKKVRQELADTGVLVNFAGIEIARMTLNNMLVINQTELYYSILSGAHRHDGIHCPMSYLCQTYGVSGTWAYDVNVDSALRELEAQSFVALDVNEKDRIVSIRPVVSVTYATKHIPKYHTRQEVMAGLETLEDE